VGAARQSNLLRMPFACVGLDWARPYRPSGFGLPLPKDRIDQIAAATAVACTDRSKSRWKNKTNEQIRKSKHSRKKLQPRSTNLMN